MMKKMGLLLLMAGLITGMPLNTPAQDNAEEELLALDEDSMNSILDELIGQMGEEPAPAQVKETTAKERQESVTPAETTAEKVKEMPTEEMFEAGIPLEAEPAAVEPYLEQEVQAAETVAEPLEPEALGEMAATAEPPELEAAVESMEPEALGEMAATAEPAELEAAAASMEPAALEGAALDAQPRFFEGDDAAEEEPLAFAAEEDADFQAVPEPEGEITPPLAQAEPVQPETDGAMFESTESITTTEPEPRESAAWISEPPVEEYPEAAVSELDAPPEEESEVVEMEASAPVAAGSQGKMVKSEQIINNSIKISRQREDHLLITVGDVVFLPTPAFKTIRPEEKYFIYKKMEKRLSGIGAKPLTWFEKVGKLKILEINNQLSIARVIAAHDVIKKGDWVYLSNYP